MYIWYYITYSSLTEDMSPVSVLWDLLLSRALLTKLKQGRVKESLGISDTSFTYTCYKIVHRGTVAIESFVCMFDYQCCSL